MAHLIKLEDYISRYQFDLHRYPSQYSRMKKERWYYLKSEWEHVQSESVKDRNEERTEPLSKMKEKNFISRTLHRLSFSKHRNQVEIELRNPLSSADGRMKNLTLEGLRNSFLDDLYHSQLRWASSSLLEESSIHPYYKTDRWLRLFTQQFPDNYFLMYKPVFYIKKAPIELDLILISPTEIICVTLIEGDNHSVFEANSGRFWTEYVDQKKKKIISPLVAMSRMTGVIKWILEQENVSYPIRKVVMSPTSLIDNKSLGTNIDLIDSRTFESWVNQMKRHPSPLKHDQMKITSLLLHYCSTIAEQQPSEVEEPARDDHESGYVGDEGKPE